RRHQSPGRPPRRAHRGTHEMTAAWPGALLRRADVQLFLTSFLGLYAELLCIRWMPAHVRFLSYFTNFILLASFLGLGVGILSARRKLPLGNLLGQVTPPLRAYAFDIGGSLAGIAAFFLLSWFEQPPAVWFVGLLVMTLLLAGPTWRDRAFMVVPLVISAIIAWNIGQG